MSKHIKVYEEFFGTRDCELTGLNGADIHHIVAKQMGGSKIRDNIENLMALTRQAHEYFGDKKQFKEWLQEWHDQYMKHQTPMYIIRPDDPILKEYLIKIYGSYL